MDVQLASNISNQDTENTQAFDLTPLLIILIPKTTEMQHAPDSRNHEQVDRHKTHLLQTSPSPNNRLAQNRRTGSFKSNLIRFTWPSLIIEYGNTLSPGHVL